MILIIQLIGFLVIYCLRRYESNVKQEETVKTTNILLLVMVLISVSENYCSNKSDYEQKYTEKIKELYTYFDGNYPSGLFITVNSFVQIGTLGLIAEKYDSSTNSFMIPNLLNTVACLTTILKYKQSKKIDFNPNYCSRPAFNHSIKKNFKEKIYRAVTLSSTVLSFGVSLYNYFSMPNNDALCGLDLGVSTGLCCLCIGENIGNEILRNYIKKKWQSL